MKITSKQRNLWNKLQPVNRVAATDTYKRTMAGSSTIFSDNFSVYNLAARKSLKEEGAAGRYIMAGLEKMLYPWFMNPVDKEEVEEAKEFFTKRAQVKKFAERAWQSVLDNNGRFPIDIYSLPGGQAFLAKDGKYVPFVSVEGTGALISHLEPHLEHGYAPLIQATKARLMKEAVGAQFAEFGLRSDENENNHVTLLMALYVGGGIQLTSDDLAALLFPEYFKDIGTVGHEFIMAYQRRGLTLEQAQKQAFRDFVKANERSALLPDVINTIHSGLPAILELVKEYEGSGKVIMPRFDSGDINEQCLIWKNMTLNAGIEKTKIVVEDGYTPKKGRETKQKYAAAGFDPEEIIVGAGGYFRQNCTRDDASLVYKRSATEHAGILEESIKFSDTPGKESIPGRVRIYGRESTIIVAQEGEKIFGIPLMQKVVENGRIIYDESLKQQYERSEETWNQYDKIEYSPRTLEIISSRQRERDSILKNLRR